MDRSDHAKYPTLTCQRNAAAEHSDHSLRVPYRRLPAVSQRDRPADIPAPPLAALGLAPPTLQRLHKLELDDCAALMRVPPEDLWRRLGRTALVDVVQRLRHHGLPEPALNAQQLSRLGLLEAAPPETPAEPLTTFESLWPRVSNVLRAALHDRGFDTVIEAAPRSRDDVRLLYRLGRAQLRVLHELFSEAALRAEGEDEHTLLTAVTLVEAWMESSGRAPKSRSGSAPKAARRAAGRSGVETGRGSPG